MTVGWTNSSEENLTFLGRKLSAKTFETPTMLPDTYSFSFGLLWEEESKKKCRNNKVCTFKRQATRDRSVPNVKLKEKKHKKRK